MRMLRMEIPMAFTYDFFKNTLSDLIATSNNVQSVKILVYRKAGGKYLPTNNDIDYLITTTSSKTILKTTYIVDVFKDHMVNSGLFSTIKHSNKLIQVLGSIYAADNELDNTVLMNEKKQVVEFNNGNLFGVIKNKIITPSLSSGCLNGIARKKLIEAIQKNESLELEEKELSPFDLLKFDALFMTNAIVGIQPVTQFKKKQYDVDKVGSLSELFKKTQMESLKDLNRSKKV